MATLRVIIRVVWIGLFAYIALVTFVFAGLSYSEGDHLGAIVATGMLAISLLAMQTVNRNAFRIRAWKPRVAGKTVIVGVAIHYSAMIIGVSFGAAFSAKDGSTGGIIAVLVQQAVLTGAARILVNQFRQSDAVRSDRNEQGG